MAEGLLQGLFGALQRMRPGFADDMYKMAMLKRLEQNDAMEQGVRQQEDADRMFAMQRAGAPERLAQQGMQDGADISYHGAPSQIDVTPGNPNLGMQPSALNPIHDQPMTRIGGLRNAIPETLRPQTDAMFGADPTAGLKAGIASLAPPDAGAPFTLNEGDTRYDGKGNVIATAAPKKTTLTERQRNLAAAGVPEDSPEGKRYLLNEDATDNDEPLSDKDLDYAAELFNRTGQMPAIGFGTNAGKERKRILSRAQQLSSSAGKTVGDVLSDRAGVKAGQSSLTQLTRQMGMVNSFKQTAVMNAKMVLELAPKGGAQGQSPIINQWIQAGRRKIAGNPDVAAFDTALVTFKNEYAKIMSGATGAAGITDAARKEADELIGKADTQEQLQAIIGIMIQEMDNREKSIADEIEKARSGISGNPSPTKKTAGIPFKSAASAPGSAQRHKIVAIE